MKLSHRADGRKLGTMYLATLEDENGTWGDDPVAAGTRAEVEQCARDKFKAAPAYCTIVIYHCSLVCELDVD